MKTPNPIILDSPNGILYISNGIKRWAYTTYGDEIVELPWSRVYFYLSIDGGCCWLNWQQLITHAMLLNMLPERFLEGSIIRDGIDGKQTMNLA